eukprot:3215831-Rhodomonas_salina.2
MVHRKLSSTGFARKSPVSIVRKNWMTSWGSERYAMLRNKRPGQERKGLSRLEGEGEGEGGGAGRTKGVVEAFVDLCLT